MIHQRVCSLLIAVMATLSVAAVAGCQLIKVNGKPMVKPSASSGESQASATSSSGGASSPASVVTSQPRAASQPVAPSGGPKPEYAAVSKIGWTLDRCIRFLEKADEHLSSIRTAYTMTDAERGAESFEFELKTYIEGRDEAYKIDIRIKTWNGEANGNIKVAEWIPKCDAQLPKYVARAKAAVGEAEKALGQSAADRAAAKSAAKECKFKSCGSNGVSVSDESAPLSARFETAMQSQLRSHLTPENDEDRAQYQFEAFQRVCFTGQAWMHQAFDKPYDADGVFNLCKNAITEFRSKYAAQLKKLRARFPNDYHVAELDKLLADLKQYVAKEAKRHAQEQADYAKEQQRKKEQAAKHAAFMAKLKGDRPGVYKQYCRYSFSGTPTSKEWICKEDFLGDDEDDDITRTCKFTFKGNKLANKQCSEAKADN